VLISEDKSIFRAKIKEPVEIEQEEQGLYIFNAQSCPGGVASLHVPVASPTRVNPMWLPRALTEQLQVAIKLPEGVEVLAMPPQIEINNQAGKMHCSAWVDEGVLYFQRNIVVNQQLISKDDYPALRMLLIEWQADDASRFVFKKSEDKKES